MPDRDAHLLAAKRNKSLALHLIANGEASWAVVLAFYSALHLVDAYLAQADIHPADHNSRRGAIERVGSLREVRTPYRKLQVRSNWVRYELREIEAREAEQLLASDLGDIERHLSTLLGFDVT